MKMTPHSREHADPVFSVSSRRAVVSTSLLRRLVLASAAGLSLFTLVDMARAQQPKAPDDAAPAGFATPFPETDIYRVQIYGDALAEGLAPALADVLANEQRLQINRKHRPIGAVVRMEWEDDIKAEEANRDTVHIAIVMTGLFDKQAIKMSPTAKPLTIGSDEWKEEYARRFEKLLRVIKKRNAALYVIGQPILRNPSQNGQAEIISDLMRQRAAANGAKFIDIHETFQDDSGGFSQFGPDMSGNRVKLREGDGVTLTSLGQRKLAHVIERDLKRDVDQAVSDRAIPLAGDDAEQKRLNPAKASGGATLSGWRGSVTVGAKPTVASQLPAASSVGDLGGDQKADNGRVTLRTISATGREETTTIEIVRPAIPAAVIALLTRRDASADRNGQPGEGVIEDVGGGLTVVNSVSTLGEGVSQSGVKRKASAAQTAYFKVIKGEYLPPKPGRADDFTWPRPEPTVTAPVEPPRAQPARVQPTQTQSPRPATGSATRPRG